MGNVAHCSPTKDFFINMLTRDIDLNDAILDLLDNCLDGAIRSIKSDTIQDVEKKYSGFHANITINNKFFKIQDNCGGISRDIAENYAFRMGRDGKRDNLPTIGIYGIGMKRAIFKIGKSAYVLTKNKTDKFSVKIPVDWESNDKWDFPIDENPTDETLIEDGTIVYIDHLTEGVAAKWCDKCCIDNCVQDLISKIRESYSLILEKGFCINVNGIPVAYNPIQLLASADLTGIKPYIFKKTYGDVSVQLVVGFYAPPPSEEELDEGNENKRSSGEAGWTVICNDRVVVYNDKSHLTGWGEAGIPQYHTQFIGIKGIVIFESNDPAKLPMTTTKRGLDISSPIYADVKNRMRDGLKMFTNYTNQWKGRNKEERVHSSQTESISYKILLQDQTTEQKLGITFKNKNEGKIYQPSLPHPSNDKKYVIIRYSKPIDEVDIVKNYFSNDDSIQMKPSEVGDECFKYILDIQKGREK